MRPSKAEAKKARAMEAQAIEMVAINESLARIEAKLDRLLAKGSSSGTRNSGEAAKKKDEETAPAKPAKAEEKAKEETPSVESEPETESKPGTDADPDKQPEVQPAE